MMKKQLWIITSLFVAMTFALFASCQEEDPQKEITDHIEGTWTLTQATAAYKLAYIQDQVRTPLNNRALQSVFGSTTFTFGEDGRLSVGGNDACAYQVSEDGKTLTMVISDESLPINNIMLVNDILELTDTRMELSLSANEVVSIIVKEVLDLDLSTIPLDATVSLVFTR